MGLNTGTVLAFVAFSLVLTLNGTSASKRISWFDLLEHKLKENRGCGGIIHGSMSGKAILWERASSALYELGRKRKKSKTTAVKIHSKCSMRDYLFLITLILSGDISLNPGPVKNPCSVCFGPVAKNHRAVSCDNCVRWTHIKCEGINPRRYKAMVEIIKADGNFTYVCKPCISSQLPFYCLDEDEFFDTLGINVPEDDKVYSYTEADFTSLKGKKD